MDIRESKALQVIQAYLALADKVDIRGFQVTLESRDYLGIVETREFRDTLDSQGSQATLAYRAYQVIRDIAASPDIPGFRDIQGYQGIVELQVTLELRVPQVTRDLADFLESLVSPGSRVTPGLKEHLDIAVNMEPPDTRGSQGYLDIRASLVTQELKE